MPTANISPRRLPANRANAALATGPRSPQGKTRSAQNARKHRFTSTAAPFYRRAVEEFKRLRALREE